MATRIVKDQGMGRATGSQTVSMEWPERLMRRTVDHEMVQRVAMNKSPVSRRGRKARRKVQAGFTVGMYESGSPAPQQVKRSQPVMVERTKREADCLSLAQPPKLSNKAKGANSAWDSNRLAERNSSGSSNTASLSYRSGPSAGSHLRNPVANRHTSR